MFKGRIFWTVIFCALFINSNALEQQVTKAKIALTNYTVVSNAQVASLSGSISFLNNQYDFRKAGDSVSKVYVLSISFTESDKPVNANIGFNGLTGKRGEVVISKDITLYLNDYTFTFTIPLAAFNLPEGEHSLTPHLTVVQKGKSQIGEVQVLPAIKLKVPATRQVKIIVGDFLVDSLDGHNEYWDYYFLNLRDANPDLRWGVYYGGQTCHVSDVIYNVFYYGGTGTDTAVVTIAKGDHLLLQVRDWDQLSFDDIIGKLDVNPDLAEYNNSGFVTRKMGKVKSIHYSVKALGQ